jgi:hypothetical protein
VHFYFSALLRFYLVIIPCIIILFLQLLSTNHKCTQPYYSEDEDGYEEFFDGEFQAMRCLGCDSCSVMESSAVLLPKRVILVFRDIIYVINILYL